MSDSQWKLVRVNDIALACDMAGGTVRASRVARMVVQLVSDVRAIDDTGASRTRAMISEALVL